jgi:hypothetical protein
MIPILFHTVAFLARYARFCYEHTKAIRNAHHGHRGAHRTGVTTRRLEGYRSHLEGGVGGIASCAYDNFFALTAGKTAFHVRQT